MAVVNSFAKFWGADYPAEADVLATAPVYGDQINVLQGTATSEVVPVYPSVENVLLDVQFGNVGDVPMVGVFEHADPSIVKLDETYGAYGTEYYGDLECVEPNPCDLFPPYDPPAGGDCAQSGWLI